jgi:hypothetical protein
VVNAKGTGTNIVGVETTDATSFFSVKTSTIFGSTYDVNRAAGTIQLGYTDLFNNNPNGNSFVTTQEPRIVTFGILGDLLIDERYFMVPGTIPVANIEKQFSSVTLAATNFFKVPVSQAMCMIAFTGTYSRAPLPVGVTITFDVFKNEILTPVATLVLDENTPNSRKTITTTSAVFLPSDTYSVVVTTVNNPVGDTRDGTVFTISLY